MCATDMFTAVRPRRYSGWCEPRAACSETAKQSLHHEAGAGAYVEKAPRRIGRDRGIQNVGHGRDLQDPEDGLDPKRPFSSLTSVMTVAGSGRVPMRKKPRRLSFRNPVGSTQLGVLLAQPAKFVGLAGAGPVEALTVIRLVLGDPVTQRFGMHTELFGQTLDYRLGVGLPVQPHRTLAQHVRVGEL